MGIRVVVYKNQPLGFGCEYQSPEDSQGFEVCQSRKYVVCKFSYSLIFIHSHHDDVILTLSHSWIILGAFGESAKSYILLFDRLGSCALGPVKM